MKRNRKTEAMLEEIRKRGGVVGVSDRFGDEELQAFLQTILDCPDCREEAERNRRVPPSRKEH